MLPAASRLSSGATIREVSRRGARATRSGISVSMIVEPAETVNAPAMAARGTVVVGRRAGGAVERNRLRRRVRHVLAGCWDALPAGSRFVVRAGPEAAALGTGALERATRAALRASVERCTGRSA